MPQIKFLNQQELHLQISSMIEKTWLFKHMYLVNDPLIWVFKTMSQKYRELILIEHVVRLFFLRILTANLKGKTSDWTVIKKFRSKKYIIRTTLLYNFFNIETRTNRWTDTRRYFPDTRQPTKSATWRFKNVRINKIGINPVGGHIGSFDMHKKFWF